MFHLTTTWASKTPLSRVRERLKSLRSKQRQRKPEREKAEERGARGNGEDEENGYIVERMKGNRETT